MRVAIDARKLHDFGIGTYIRNLLRQLARIDHDTEYVLLCGEADLGVASGNGKGQIFVKGQVIKTVPEADIVATLIEEANRLAAEMGPDAAIGTAQVVTS